MFKEVISNTPLTTTAAESFFSGSGNGIMSSSSYRCDISLLATMRALMNERRCGNNILVYTTSISARQSRLDSMTPSEIIYRSIGNIDASVINNAFIFAEITGDTDVSARTYKVIEENFVSKYAGFKRLDSVTALFRSMFNCMCFVSEEQKTTIVVTEQIDLRRYHYMQCALPGMLPWYYDREKGLSELEMKLIYSLREKTPDKYIECLNEIAAQYDFEKARIRQLLNGYEKVYERTEIRRLESEISSTQADIDRYYEYIAMQMRELRDKNIRLIGLKTSEETGDSSGVMNVFLTNKNLILDHMDNGNYELTFIVKGYLENYDPEAARKAIDNARSFVYQFCSDRTITAAGMKKLATAIFIDEIIKVKMCASYTIKPTSRNGRYVVGNSHYSYNGLTDTHMPNPHVNQYGCIGNYEQYMNDAIQSGDYVTAICQCMVSNSSLAFSDGAVLPHFFEYIVDNRTSKWFELPDGTSVSAIDAIKWIVEQENNESTETVEE